MYFDQIKVLNMIIDITTYIYVLRSCIPTISKSTKPLLFVLRFLNDCKLIVKSYYVKIRPS